VEPRPFQEVQVGALAVVREVLAVVPEEASEVALVDRLVVLVAVLS
jgi:hypothetical protein